MSRKRAQLPELYKAKRRCAPSASSSQANGDSSSQTDTNGVADPASDSRTALLFLRGLFPVEKFECRLPPVLLKHQLYSIMRDRTQADKQVNDLRTNREVKLFKLGPEASSRCLVFADDYRKHVIKVMTDLKLDSALIDKVIKHILDQCTDISLDKETLLKNYCFTDGEITQLVKASVLTVRDVGNWWLSIPNAGLFTKTFSRGRKALITMISKSKYKEILRGCLNHVPRHCMIGHFPLANAACQGNINCGFSISGGNLVIAFQGEPTNKGRGAPSDGDLVTVGGTTTQIVLEQRQWPKVARLGISYHIHDIIGADLVDCIETNSGELLRLRE